MNTFHVTVNNKLAVLTLDRGRSNPINAEMVSELTAYILSIADDDEIGGLILTGKGGFFSAGLDLIEVYDYNEQQSREFWTSFLNLQAVLVNFKKPLVAAISGHSPAGGCVMALCCDYRIMAAGKFIIGLNEIPVGIIVPESIFNLYAFCIGRRKAYQYLLEGKLLLVDEALKDGLVDEVCEPAELMTAAEKKIRTYMNLNPVTWGQSKLNLRGELLKQMNADQSETLEMMLKQWWSKETRAALQIIIMNLKSPQSKKA